MDLDAASIAPLGPRQVTDQRPITAANVEHTRTRRNHLGNQPQIDAHVLCNEALGVVVVIIAGGGATSPQERRWAGPRPANPEPKPATPSTESVQSL
jgi:hypothetical protein